MGNVISLGDGLSIKTLKSGKKVYVVEFSEFKQRKRKVIGYCDVINVTMAKAIAEGFRRQVGIALTCDQAFETWFERFASLQTKTYANQKYRYYKYISPAWGKTQIRAITALDVQGLLALYRDKPTLANRLIQLMSSVYNKCAKWGYVSGANPCQHVDKNKLQSRTRHLSASEMQRIQTALDRLENQNMADAFRLMIYTGCRKTEILSLKWSQVDIDAKMFEPHDIDPLGITQQLRRERIDGNLFKRRLNCDVDKLRIFYLALGEINRLAVKLSLRVVRPLIYRAEILQRASVLSRFNINHSAQVRRYCV